MGHSDIPKQQKRETMKRLEAEGRWGPACDRREELRDGGMSADEAWVQMEEEYPPLPLPEPSADDEAQTQADKDIQDLLDRTEGVDVLMLDEMEWAYKRVAVSNIQPKDAPTAGSYSMWLWSQEDRGRFMNAATTKLMNREEEKAREKEQRKDLGLDEVKRLLAEVKEDVAAKWRRELLENTSSAVTEAVWEMLSNWTSSFDVELVPEAAERLELQMIELVNKSIAVAAEEPDAFRVEVQGLS